MFRSAILAMCLGSAAAFVAPLQAAAPKTVVKADFSGALGVQPPLGLFDPLGMLDNADQDRFDRLRYVEVKHGRIAMLAVLGHVVTTAGIRLPGNIDYSGHKFSDVGVGIKALGDIPTGGLVQIFSFIFLFETFIMKDQAAGFEGKAEFPGDFTQGGVHSFGWGKLSESQKMQKRAVELNNGRAAQMGILGLMVHEMIDGHPYVINGLVGLPSPTF